MSKILLIVLFVALCSLHAWPQAISHVRVKGRIIDKETQQPLADATVALLYAKDSSRAASGFTDKNGAFALDEVQPGDYRLYITYLGYQQQLKSVTIPADTLMQLGSIALQKTGVTLGMVEIVEVRMPMVVKKDTLEFNADYYKTRENAEMEELLKKLPGVEITPDGTIKVNGETVKRILVDGKPFFGDDPKLATRNLPADMIDKIQLVDRKSDQAQFSGAADGKTEKTVNITIKEEKKNSFLGRAMGGYGTDERFALNGNLNRFGDQQLSFLGGGNNVNGSQENGMQIGGNGITRIWNAGANYSTVIGSALKLSGSYYMNDMHTDNERISTRQNLLPDTTYYYNQQTHSLSNGSSHTSDLRVEYRPDTLHTVIASINANYVKNNDSQENVFESLSGQKQLINSGNIYNENTSASPNITTNLFFGKRFKRTGRTFSTNIQASFNTNKQQQFNSSNDLFMQPDGEMFRDTINQRNDINNRNQVISFNFTYTEPLYKDHFLDAVYTYNRSMTSADKLAYDYNAAKGAYDRPNDSLSNSFKNTFVLQHSSLSFRTQKAKYDYSIGVLMQLSNLYNNNISGHNKLWKNTNSFFPVAVFNYAFSSNHRLRLQYNGSTQPPDVNLLQPVPNNNNPLYIQLGNPDLKPTVMHSFNVGYNTFNPGTFQGMNFNASAVLFTNKIITASRLDSLGRQVSQPLNANGVYNLGVNITNAFRLKKIHTDINTNTMIAFNRDINYTNDQPGDVKNLYVSQHISFNYNYERLLDLAFRTGINYNGARYSLQKGSNIDLYSYTAALSGNIILPIGFSIGGNVNYQHNAGITAAYNQNVTMVNAYIARSVFRRKTGLMKLQGFDLLNQNHAVMRTYGTNYIEDMQATVLQRFFMLSFTCFLKPGNKK
ncbi:outer membrane beta-barrel protein [Chitinophaga sp. GbtcB8]|uniref:outer membrane beta-barrel protein n=1 Tax=Chitinophaga sp. GbtcB8 TaxID=2824753 RepID=UPI001C2F4170|nr:outer membrane beta-barrel protein [Chitinophaga sp. GbtcB8]